MIAAILIIGFGFLCFLLGWTLAVDRYKDCVRKFVDDHIIEDDNPPGSL